MINLSYRYGTAGPEAIDVVNANTAYLGLQGDDIFDFRGTGDLRIALGASGDDVYNVYTSGLISDFAGNDTVNLFNVVGSAAQSYSATIDGRHLLLIDEAAQSYAVLIDYANPAFRPERINFAENLGTPGFGDPNTIFTDGFLGNYAWSEVGTFGLQPRSTAEVNAAIAQADTIETAFLVEENARAVARLYEAGLDRALDVGGLNFWIDATDQGLSYEQIAGGFLDSSEFTRRFGDDDAMSAQTFVSVMYANVLGRIGDAAGFNFWVDSLRSGALSKEEVLVSFANSTENIQNTPYLAGLAEVAPGVWDFA